MVLVVMYVTYINMSMINDIKEWMIIRIAISICVAVLMYIILYRSNPYIVLMSNLIAVSILDLVDSVPIQIIHNTHLSNNIDYQKYDKITDMIVYLSVILLHLICIREITTFEIVLLSLYLYRLVGVILYTDTGNSIYLVVFANFVVDNVVLYLYIRYVLHTSNRPLIIASVLIKILYEFVHHVVWKRWI